MLVHPVFLRRRVHEKTQQLRFAQIVLPHLDAAYNLARWLTRNDQDAENVVVVPPVTSSRH